MGVAGDRPAVVGGPDAQLAATAAALDGIESARVVVLVEGISDQLAVDAFARGRGWDPELSGVRIVPVGGAHALERYARRLGPLGSGLTLTGLCDVGEEEVVRRALVAAGIGRPQSRRELAACGFFVCERDLEDELIRASGRDVVLAVLAEQGDLPAFRTLTQQPAWRDRAFDAQLHRWLRAGAGRSLRYAQLLAERIDDAKVPRPIAGLLDALDTSRDRVATDERPRSESRGSLPS